MVPTQKSIDEFKQIFKKEYGKDLTDAEASEYSRNLLGFFEVLWDSASRDVRRKRRLKKEPGGFHITDGTYSCRVCHRSVTGDESWYDTWSVKCLLCQKAVTDGVVPGFVCIASDSHYRMWELKDKFKIHPQTARKMVRTGELKARIITAEDGKAYEYIFLKKENPHLVSKYSPERKSYDRHRQKEGARQAREWRIKMKEERKRPKKR